MKTRFAILISLFIIFCSSCQVKQTNQLTTQDLEVYKTILDERPKEIVVIDESNVGMFGEIDTGKLREILKGLGNDTFDNFVKVNSNPTNIENKFTSSFDYSIFNKADFEKKNFELSRYYVFSRVGFSNDGKQAVVMFIDVCNPLCTKGNYILLKNQDGFWEIIQESESWKS